jgi:WXG100 family type VII secretion target
MTKAAGLFEGASSEATGHLKSVNEEMAALQASWTGDASLRFGRAMNDWEEEFTKVISQLNHMVEVMGGNAKAYAKAADDAEAIAGGWSEGLQDL